MPVPFICEGNKLNAFARACFRGNSLVRLAGVALAALFLFLLFPAASDTKPANRALASVSSTFSEYQKAAIERRARARVERWIRMAAEKKKTTVTKEPTAKAKADKQKAKTKKKAEPKKKRKREKTRRVRTKKKKTSPATASPPAVQTTPVVPRPPVQRTPVAPKRKTTPPATASPPAVQTTPVVPRPPVQTTPAVRRPPVQTTPAAPVPPVMTTPAPLVPPPGGPSPPSGQTRCPDGTKLVGGVCSDGSPPAETTTPAGPSPPVMTTPVPLVPPPPAATIPPPPGSGGQIPFPSRCQLQPNLPECRPKPRPRDCPKGQERVSGICQDGSSQPPPESHPRNLAPFRAAQTTESID